jgi:hypothetical protein
MIEAGEFNTVSEGYTDVDAAITEGKWADYIKAQIERVPAKLGTVGRNAFVTQDTALFKGMSRMVQYGDFLSKSVLYDHLISEGKSPQQARRFVTEAFVNYNFLPGRTRTLLDNFGLTWFMHYKIRILKVALNMIQQNPLRSLFSLGGAGNVLDIGSPLADNIVAVTADGRLPFALGPEMAFNAPYLLPVMQVGGAAI